MVGLFLRPYVERRILLLTPLVGLAVAGLAIAFAAGTGKGSAEVLFSGQSALGPFVDNAASYTVGAVVLLLVCKGIAYGVSLAAASAADRRSRPCSSGRRGGVALSHLPGLLARRRRCHGDRRDVRRLLRLPLTSVLLASLLLASDGLAVMPLVIVAVVVAYVISARFTPTPAPDRAAAGGPAADVPAPYRPPRPRRTRPQPALYRSPGLPGKSPPS